MAAAFENMTEELDDITQCSICLEAFKDPKVLPCIHTFCLQCLKKVCSDKGSSAGVTCPFCRKVFTVPERGLEHLPNNYLINRLLQVNHKRQQPLMTTKTEKIREQLKLDIQNVESCSLQSREKLKNIERARKDLIKQVSATETQISLKYDQLVNFLISRRSQLLEELNSFKDKRLKEVENVKKQAEKQFVIMDSFTKHCLNIKDNGTAGEISSAASNLHAQAMDLVKTSKEFNEWDLSIIDVVLQPSSCITSDNVRSLIGTLVFKERIAEKLKKDEELSDDVNLTSFLKHPMLPRIITQKGEKGSIRGITVCLDELFIVRGARQIDTYTNKSLTFIRHLAISDSKSLVAVVACLQNRCLYISDFVQRIIYRFDLQLNSVIKQWSVGKKCEGLSITQSHNVLVSLQTVNQINEYSPDGILTREIKLQGLEDPCHCIQLSGERFLVSHQGTKQSGVCIVDANGCVIQSPEKHVEKTWGIEQTSGPRHMVVDKCGNVLVANCNSDRVEVLSSDLNHLGDVEIRGDKINGPHALHLDVSNRRLYVGEYWGVRLLVINY